MTKFQLAGKDLMLVGVPGNNVLIMNDVANNIGLPPGSWQIVGSGTVSQITEKEAIEIVEYDVDNDDEGTAFVRIKDYETGDWDADGFLESLTSLVRSYGFENLDEVVMLKNENV